MREREDEDARLAVLESLKQALGRGEPVNLVVRDVLILLTVLEKGLHGRLFVVIEADDALRTMTEEAVTTIEGVVSKVVAAACQSSRPRRRTPCSAKSLVIP